MHELVRRHIQHGERRPVRRFAERHEALALGSEGRSYEEGVAGQHAEVVDHIKNSAILAIEACPTMALQEIVVGPPGVHVGVDDAGIRPRVVRVGGDVAVEQPPVNQAVEYRFATPSVEGKNLGWT